MGSPKVLILSILFALAIAGIRSEDGAIAIHADVAGAEDSDSPLKFEIEQLKPKIVFLELAILEKEKELKNKDEKIEQLEREIQKMSSSVVSLQSDVELLQKKGALDAEELVGKATARSNELERKVEKLKIDLEKKTRQTNTLEERTIKAENKVQELNLKLETLQKTNDVQMHKIQKTERALQVAEELMKAQLEATSKLKELKEVHEAWLPPWLAYRVAHFQEIVAVQWTKRGEPIFSVLMQKVSERSGQAQKWVKPHLETAKTKWIPIMKTKWTAVTTTIRPHVENTCTKTVEVFEAYRSTATPHIVKLQEFADPYIQEARKFSKPYIEQVATVTKPHVEKVRSFLKPYTRRVVYGYGKFLKTARTYHHQVQKTVKKNLKKYEFAKHLATKEFVWFVASAALALPIFLVYSMLSAIFGKKATKPARSTRSHNHRRHKRRHTDQ